MEPIPNDFPISLKSWSSKPNDATALGTLIQRINIERGGFANITEESLRQEIAQAEAGDSEADNGISDEEETEEPDRSKDLMTAREEMVVQIDAAHQSAMYALDFVSLLLSKDAPVQAGLSISPALRDLVGMGTLGVDKLQASRVTDVQKQDNQQVAKGWKSQSLNKTVDSILASATRLEKEIELETKYWEQVLAVSDNGWAVCQLPNEKHTLGVRFGFLEASPAFKNRSLAALRRNLDGSISLDQGMAGSDPKSLRVRIQVDGVDTGSSPVPEPAPEYAPVESLILEARNTIFASELWQELNREARTMGALGVRAKGDTLTLPLTPEKTVVLDLISLNDTVIPSPNADDSIAEVLSLSLHLLLSYSHRQSYRRRTFPPPPISSAKRQQPACNLFRPLLTLLAHQSTLVSIRKLLSPLIVAIVKTGLTHQPSYKLASTSPSSNAMAQLPIPERTLASLTDRLESTLNFSITKTTSVLVIIRTAMHPIPSSIFGLSLSPGSPLTTTCPPPTTVTSFSQLSSYIYYATACAIASSFASNVNSVNTASPPLFVWEMTHNASTLRRLVLGTAFTKQLSFEVMQVEGSDVQTEVEVLNAGTTGKRGVKLRVTWNYMITSAMSPNNSVRKSESRSRDRCVNGKKKEGEGVYEWVAWEKEERNGWDNGEGEVVRSLVDVVEDAGR